MYKKILIATDGSELAGRALEHGLKLAKLVGAEVTILTVTEPAAVVGAGYASIAGTMIDPMPELIQAQEDAAKQVLATAETAAKDAGVVVQTRLIDNSFPAEGIVAAAAETGADLIVMGSHGRRGIGRLLLGSQTSNVLAHSKVPVLVTR
jgi:nucleotide-binding universal stress UspA family protein